MLRFSLTEDGHSIKLDSFDLNSERAGLYSYFKKKSKAAAARRKSFCERMQGMKDKLTGEEAKNDPNSRINKSLRRWDCG